MRTAAAADDTASREVLPSVSARVTDTVLQRPANLPSDAALVAAAWLVLPLVSAALTLLYFDLAVRHDSEEPSAGMLPAP